MLQLKRISAGLYQALDGRLVIQREVSQQTHRAAEYSWAVYLDGKQLFGTDFETKKDAITYTERELNESKIK